MLLFSSFLIGGVALGVCWLSVVQYTDLNAHFNEQIVNCKFSIGSLALFLLRGVPSLLYLDDTK